MIESSLAESTASEVVPVIDEEVHRADVVQRAEGKRLNPFAVFHEWYGEIATRRPEDTARTYRGLVNTALGRLGANPLELDAKTINEYLAGIRKATTANLTRNAFADLTAFLVRRGYAAHDPLAVVKRRRPGRKRVKRSLEWDELIRVLIAATWAGRYHTRWVGERDALMFLANAYTGPRPGEWCRLNTTDVDLDRAELRIVDTKNDDDRIVPIPTKIVPVFADLCRGRVGRVSDVGVGQYWQKFKRAAMLAGIPPEKARPYALRHTFGLMLTKAKVDPRVRAELMGHRDLRSQFGYTIPENDMLRDAVELLA